MMNRLTVFAATLALVATRASFTLGEAYELYPKGIDVVPSTATRTIYVDSLCTVPFVTSTSRGYTKIKRGEPFDPGDGRIQINTEIVDMTQRNDEAGVSVEAPGGSNPSDADDPPCEVGGPSADGGPGCSPGQIRQQTAGVDFPADSFFDVYYELAAPGGPSVFTAEPIRVQAVITGIPPTSITYTPAPGTCAAIRNRADPSAPIMGYLGTSGHEMGGRNHYQCYKAKDLKQPKFQATTVSLSDQFGAQPQVDVKKPFLICNPADKNHEGIPEPSAHLCCYKVKGSRLPAPVQVEIEDQFGKLQLGKIKKPRLLCQPCAKREM